jgi:uncharacterized protein (TIGR02246 family)
MNKTLRLLACLVLVTPLFFTPVFAASGEEGEVRKAVTNEVEAWNRHDMQAFAKAFASDADYVNVGGKWTKGRRAIQVNHAYLHGTIPVDTAGVDVPHEFYGIFKTSTIRSTQIDVRFLRKDVAVAHVSSEMSGDARTPSPRKFMLTLVLVREDGAWLIAAAQDTEISRPAELNSPS